MHVILDVDGCLLNWKAGFIDWMVKNSFFKSYNSWAEDSYSFTEYAQLPDGEPFPPGLEKPLMSLFNETHYIEKLSPIDGAIKTVRRFHEAGATIKVVTTFSDKYEAMRMREKNLIDVFGNVFQDIVCLPLRTSKFDFLSKQHPESYFVDDLPQHIGDSIKAGIDPHHVFMVAQPYNQKFDIIDFPLWNRGPWAMINRNILQ